MPLSAPLAVFLAVLSTLIVPIPEELTLLAAGYLARSGKLPVAEAFAMAYLGVMIGDCTTFFVARALLPRLLATRLGERFLHPSRRAWAEALVSRRGARTIVVARFLVGLRGPVYMALGASKYPGGRFVVINGLVGLVEVAALVGLGFLLGPSDRLLHGVREVELAVAATLVFALLLPLLLGQLFKKRFT